MKTYQINLTAMELDLIFKLLDKAPTVGIETQRQVLQLADKIAAFAAKVASNGEKTETV